MQRIWQSLRLNAERHGVANDQPAKNRSASTQCQIDDEQASLLDGGSLITSPREFFDGQMEPCWRQKQPVRNDVNCHNCHLINSNLLFIASYYKEAASQPLSTVDKQLPSQI